MAVLAESPNPATPPRRLPAGLRTALLGLLVLSMAGEAGAQDPTPGSAAPAPVQSEPPAPAEDAAVPPEVASPPGFWRRLAGTTPMGMAPPETTGFWKRTGRGLAATWSGGHFEAWVPGYIWHTPWGYSDAQRERYNDAAWGLGLGPSAIDDKGHTRLLYAMGSADSFSNFQYMVGYAWMAHSLSKEDGMHLGGGYTMLLIGRKDRLNYTPLPLVLPMGGLGFRRFEVMTTYVPFLEVGLFMARIRLK